MQGSITDRSFSRHNPKTPSIEREKPLLYLKIKFDSENSITANVYKDDTSNSVADRVFR